MDAGSDRAVALMSIQPEFAERILAGEKRVEFRKTYFRYKVSHVIVYSSNPVQKIVGFFEVEALELDDPASLWKRYSSVGGIARSAFEAYYDGCRRGVAIRIGRTFRLQKPLPLSSLTDTQPPPQSFRYVGAAALRLLASDALAC